MYLSALYLVVVKQFLSLMIQKVQRPPECLEFKFGLDMNRHSDRVVSDAL